MSPARSASAFGQHIAVSLWLTVHLSKNSYAPPALGSRASKTIRECPGEPEAHRYVLHQRRPGVNALPTTPKSESSVARCLLPRRFRSAKRNKKPFGRFCSLPPPRFFHPDSDKQWPAVDCGWGRTQYGVHPVG